MNTSSPLRLCLPLVLACLSSAPASAAVMLLDFVDGNGASTVDQYTGVAGNGWNNAWQTAANSSTMSGTVVSATPLAGGGNYLSVTFNSTGATSPQGTVFRQYNGTSAGVNASENHSFSFNFRGDTAISGVTQTYSIFANTSSGVTGTDGNMTWGIRANNGTWQLMQGNDSGGGAFVNTGVAFTAGLTYSFTVNVNPATMGYEVSIFNGTTTYNSGTLGFRKVSTTDGTNLYFGAVGSASGQTFTYSVDSLSVTAVPEPSALGVLGVAGACAMMRRRSRRSRDS